MIPRAVMTVMGAPASRSISSWEQIVVTRSGYLARIPLRPPLLCPGMFPRPCSIRSTTDFFHLATPILLSIQFSTVVRRISAKIIGSRFRSSLTIPVVLMPGPTVFAASCIWDQHPMVNQLQYFAGRKTFFIPEVCVFSRYIP